MSHPAIAEEAQADTADTHAAYKEAIDHLYALGQELAPLPPLPDGTPAPRRKWDLAHMRTLAAAFGDPQHSFPSVLIAGTNGKGSTAATLASILAAAGFKTGLYTSPHLVRVNERIQILNSQRTTQTDQLQIPDHTFARLFSQVDDTAAALVASGKLPHPPSFFEVLTALAFLYFAEEKVDVAILEVGLGGRLDATNIVEPIISVITDIALDHQDYLGDTIAAITREKAGILRPNGILVTLPQHPEANQAIGEAAATLNLTAISAADFIPSRSVILSAAKSPDVTPSLHPGNGVILSPAKGPDVTPSLHPGNGVILSEAKDPHSADITSEARTFLPLEPGVPHLRDGSIVAKVGIRAEHEPHSLPRNHYTLTLNNQPLTIDSPLSGHHQQRNIALAIATANTLCNLASYNTKTSNQKGYNIPIAAIEAGTRNTQWPGRLELLPPNLLLDVAHNPAGAWTLRAAIAQLPESQPRTLIFSCLSDKNLTEISRILFPLFDSSPEGGRANDHIILAPIPNPRAARVEDLLAAAQALDIPAHAAPHLEAALAQARAVTPPAGLIIATGSVYLVGAIRDLALASLQESRVPHLRDGSIVAKVGIRAEHEPFSSPTLPPHRSESATEDPEPTA